MPSSSSERRVLHVVVTPPWAGDALQRALMHRRAGDVLLLAQEAAGAACAAVALAPALADGLRAASARVLDADLAACGRSGSALRDGIAAIDDAAWVALAADCANCVTWA